MSTRYLIWHLGKIIPFQMTRDVQAAGYSFSEQWTNLQDHYIAKLLNIPLRGPVHVTGHSAVF